MISDELPLSQTVPSESLKTKSEILFSVFFVACLIKQSKEYINEFYEKKGFSIGYEDCALTMGVPIDNYQEENRKIYDKVLFTAEELSKRLIDYSYNLADLDKYYQRWETEPLPPTFPINTLPELYAEALAFLQDRNVPTGIYCLIDIGGGTVDYAVFLKTRQDENDKYSIVSKSIRPIGIEIVVNGIAKSDKLQICREYLKNFNPIGLELNGERESEFKRDLQESFSTIAVEVKEKNEARDILLGQKGVLSIIICGGGADHKWYENHILDCESRLRNALASDPYKLETRATEVLIPGAESINHRLLIARQLAQRYDDIPPLDGFPWDFEQKVIPTLNVRPNSYETGRDIQIDKYGSSV
jgi:hypothetical protein